MSSTPMQQRGGCETNSATLILLYLVSGGISSIWKTSYRVRCFVVEKPKFKKVILTKRQFLFPKHGNSKTSKISSYVIYYDKFNSKCHPTVFQLSTAMHVNLSLAVVRNRFCQRLSRESRVAQRCQRQDHQKCIIAPANGRTAEDGGKCVAIGAKATSKPPQTC